MPDSGAVAVAEAAEIHFARAKDATGLRNAAVWLALERKALARSSFPFAITLTAEGLEYDTGLRDSILIGGDH